MAKITVEYLPVVILSTIPDGAQTAYSLARIIPFVTPHVGDLILVRRSSDNTEHLIPADVNGDLDEVFLLNKMGGFSGFVITAHDQSGNGNDWTQATQNLQPRIVNSGVVEKVNGKPVMFVDDVRQDNLNVAITGAVATTAFHVYQNSRAWLSVNIGAANTRYYGLMKTGTLTDSFQNSGSPTTYVNGVSVGDSQNELFDAVLNTQVVNTFTGLDLSDASWSEFNLEYVYSAAIDGPTYIQETIIYDSDVSADRVGIELDITNYYSI